jgi:glutaredoxin
MITKYASKSCVKCKVLDGILKQAGVEYDTLYSEDNVELFEEKGINTLPTLIFSNGDKEVRLEGIVSPAQIKDAENQVK